MKKRGISRNSKERKRKKEGVLRGLFMIRIIKRFSSIQEIASYIDTQWEMGKDLKIFSTALLDENAEVVGKFYKSVTWESIHSSLVRI
jgi:hypothetical protein